MFVQVFRFIGVAMTGRMVSDILSRLVETVAEQGEDMQVNYTHRYYKYIPLPTYLCNW